MDGAVCGDAGYPETCALIRRYAVRQAGNLVHGNNRKFRRCTKRAIGLSSEAPHRLADPLGRNIRTDFIHLSSAITMRDDAGVRHAVTKHVLTLLDIPGVDARDSNMNANFSSGGVRVWHLAYGQDLSGWPLLFIPRCS